MARPAGRYSNRRTNSRRVALVAKRSTESTRRLPMEARKEYRGEEPDEDGELSTADLASRSSPETRPDGEHDDERNDEGVQPEVARDETMESLLPDEEGTGFRERWDEIQTSFVDEPRKSVQAADQLVAEVMQRLAESFARERSDLEQQWDRGEDVSTEDLRVALQRYRSFFDRLLAA
jgi:hypothetical protein